MRPEDILHEAEKYKLREDVFAAVRNLKELTPHIPLETAYDIAWLQVKRDKKIK